TSSSLKGLITAVMSFIQRTSQGTLPALTLPRAAFPPPHRRCWVRVTPPPPRRRFRRHPAVFRGREPPARHVTCVFRSPGPPASAGLGCSQPSPARTIKGPKEICPLRRLPWCHR